MADGPYCSCGDPWCTEEDVCGVVEYDPACATNPPSDRPPDPPPAVCDQDPGHDGLHSGVRHARRLRWCDHRHLAGGVLPCKECNDG